MSSKHKQSSNLPSHLAIILLALYNVVLIVWAISQSDGVKLLLYSLFPDMMSVYLWLYGSHQNRFHEQHVERHLSNIERFVRVMAGVPEEFDA
jgi:hypothetical protein